MMVSDLHGHCGKHMSLANAPGAEPQSCQGSTVENMEYQARGFNGFLLPLDRREEGGGGGGLGPFTHGARYSSKTGLFWLIAW